MDPHTHSPHPQLKYFLTIHIVLKVRSSLYHESIRVIYSIMLVIPPPSPFSLPRSPFSPLPYRCAIMSTPSLASPSCPVRLSVSISTQIRCVPDALAAYGYPCVLPNRGSQPPDTHGFPDLVCLSPIVVSTIQRALQTTPSPSHPTRQMGRQKDRQTGRIRATRTRTRTLTLPCSDNLIEHAYLYTRCSRSGQQLLIIAPPRLSAAYMRILACSIQIPKSWHP